MINDPKAIKKALMLAQAITRQVAPASVQPSDPVHRAKGGAVIPHKAPGGFLGQRAGFERPDEGVQDFTPPKLQGTQIVKEPGGQWLSGSVESALNPLSKYVNGLVYPEEILSNPSESPHLVQKAKQVHSVNEFVRKQLTRYVKNEMGTERDPVRALAERGILHVNENQLDQQPDLNYDPALGLSSQTDLGNAWEKASDLLFDKETASSWKKNQIHLKNNPWLQKVDPNTEIHDISPYASISKNLGFHHLIDELHNSVDPESGLPNHLQLNPESLGRMSVPQAVEHVHKINKWREENRADADRKKAFNSATFLHKDYPDSDYAWYELKKPKAEKEDSGDDWRDTRKYRNQSKENYGALDEALNYEGDVMGHCVGGYTPEVASGHSRIFSLRNKKTGEPHVTIEAKPSSLVYSDLVEHLGGNEQLANDYFAKGFQLRNAWKEGDEHGDLSPLGHALRLAGVPKTLDIAQIKGKGNKKPVDRYIPYVQDFVKSGNWKIVKDLQNTNLIDARHWPNLKLYKPIFEKMRKNGETLPDFLTEKENKAFHEKYKPEDAVIAKATGGVVDPQQAIRRAVMAAHSVSPEEHDRNLAKFMEGAHPSMFDKSGKPRVFYHGSGRDIHEFDPAKGNPQAIFATHDPGYASWYAERALKRHDKGEHPAVYPVHINAKNPFDYENPKHVEKVMDLFRSLDPVINADRYHGLFPAEKEQRAKDRHKLFKDAISEGEWQDIENPAVQAAIRQAGFDAFHTNEEGFKNLAAFDPRQVKSAIGNRGTFDPQDPNITKAAGGDVEPKDSVEKALELARKAQLSDTKKYGKNKKQDFKSLGSILSGVRSTKTGQLVSRYQTIEDPAAAAKAMHKDLLRLAKEGEPGRFWYERSSKSILDHVAGDKNEADNLAQLIAIYSPQTTVPVNTSNAIKAYNRAKAGDKLWNGDIIDPDKSFKTIRESDEYLKSLGGSKAGYTKIPLDDTNLRYLIAKHGNIKDYDNIATADRDLKAHLVMNKGIPFEGRKTNNFYNNLMVHIDPSRLQGSTQDLWMAKAFGFHDPAIAGGKYDFMERLTAKIAKRLKWEPHQVQAAIWTAMKARQEHILNDAKAEAVRVGLADMVEGPNKKLKFVVRPGKEYDFSDLVRDRALKADILPNHIADSSKDFSDFLKQNLANVSWESTPSTKVGHLDGFEKLSPEHKAAYHHEISKALQDENGTDLLAKHIGLLTPGSVPTLGYWEGASNPATQTLVGSTRIKAAGQLPNIDASSKKQMELYASALGFLLKQDGVGYHRPYYNPKISEANGIEYNFDKDMSPDHVVALGKALDSHAPGSALIPHGPKTVRVINFAGPEQYGDQAGFHKAATRAVESALPDHNSEHRVFASDGDLVGNDWRSNQDGQEYIQRISAAGRPDVLGFISSVLAPRVEAVDAAFAAKHGLKRNTQLEKRLRSFAPPQASGQVAQPQQPAPPVPSVAESPPAKADGGLVDRALHLVSHLSSHRKR